MKSVFKTPDRKTPGQSRACSSSQTSDKALKASNKRFNSAVETLQTIGEAHVQQETSKRQSYSRVSTFQNLKVEHIEFNKATMPVGDHPDSKYSQGKLTHSQQQPPRNPKASEQKLEDLVQEVQAQSPVPEPNFSNLWHPQPNSGPDQLIEQIAREETERHQQTKLERLNTSPPLNQPTFMADIRDELLKNSPNKRQRASSDDGLPELDLLDNDSFPGRLPSFKVYSSDGDEAQSNHSVEVACEEMLDYCNFKFPDDPKFEERMAGGAAGLAFPGPILNHMYDVIKKNKLLVGGEGQLKQAMLKC